MRTPVLLLLSTVLLLSPGAALAEGRDAPQPLERAHAHNDYEHARPLQDALDEGFTSVEADVYLVGTELLVAHDPQGVVPGRTLRSLYLDPLRARVRATGGRVHRGYTGVFQLLVDVKTDPVLTYLALDRELAAYGDVLWRWQDDVPVRGAVQVVVSGNRSRELMDAQRLRYAGFDARLADLGTVPSSLSPLVSDSFTSTFTWRGVGPMPAAERERLRTTVARAHAAGQRVRFYATPDTAPVRDAVWAELLAADVDQLNTDDLAGLRAWLLTHDAAERPAGRDPGRQDAA
jgi:hypothetical protein